MAKQITQTRTIDALIEGLKMALRIALLAAVPIIVAQLESGNGVDLRVVGIAVAIALLKGLDSFLHELGKSTDNKTLEKGLTRF